MRDTITLFHAPQTRSSGVYTLLEEIDAPYSLHILNMKAGEQRGADFLRVNPMGKVPAILHGDVLVTEQVAIFIYLADLFPEAMLAPGTTDAKRGPYLRWLVFYAACYEPALVDKFRKHDPGPRNMSPYGTFDTMLETVLAQVRIAPYLLDDTFSAADILWGTALQWGRLFGLLPEDEAMIAYIDRITGRPAARRVTERDQATAAEHSRLTAG